MSAILWLLKVWVIIFQDPKNGNPVVPDEQRLMADF
jgi:hypothetical protein